METFFDIIITKLISNIELSDKCLLNERKNSSILDKHFKTLGSLAFFCC